MREKLTFDQNEDLVVEKTKGYSSIRILLIEDSSDDARVLEKLLIEAGNIEFKLVRAGRLSEGLKYLREQYFDVILLDLLLPDGTGLDTFVRAYNEVPEIPIIVLTSLDSEALALRAVREGAQEYLVKGQVDGKLLVRSIRYAIERHRMQTALRSMLLIDDLTGLYNRRGFLIIAEQHLKLARRAKKGLLLVLSDLDNLKLVNDTYGHPEGDRALIKVAEILRETFRSSDIIARIGGDEFVALAIETSKMNADILVNRLQENVRAYNEKKVHSYRLSLSVGVACYSPDECPFSIDELLNRADKLMYEQKRKKKIERLRTY